MLKQSPSSLQIQLNYKMDKNPIEFLEGTDNKRCS